MFNIWSFYCNSLKIFLLTLILGLCIFINPVLSQSLQYFTKIYPTPYPFFEDGWYVGALPDGYIVSCSRIHAPIGETAFAFKTDLYGDTLWSAYINDSVYSHAFLHGCTISDGFVFSGYRWNINNNSYRAFLSKIDFSGNLLWYKLVGDSLINNVVKSIKSVSDGGFLLTGNIRPSNDWSGYIIKTDSLGNQLWDKDYTGLQEDDLWSIEELNDGSLIASGHTNVSLGTGSARVIKMDAFGTVQWDTSYNFLNNYSQTGRSIIQTLDGNFVIGGTSGSGFGTDRGLIFKIDTSGNILWSKVFTEFIDGTGFLYASYINSIVELADSSILSVGSIVLSTGVPSPNNYRQMLSKFDKNGTEIWRRDFTFDIQNYVYAIDLDLTFDGGFIITGRNQGFSNSDVYLVKTNCLGFVAAPIPNFSTSVNGNSVTFTNLSENSDTCIYYFGDGDSLIITSLDTIPIIHNYLTSGWQNASLVAYACGEVDTIYNSIYSGIENEFETMKQNFKIIPNPASDFINIKFSLPVQTENAEIMVLDVVGKSYNNIKVGKVDDGLNLDISNYKSGIYFLVLRVNKMSDIVLKVIKI